MRFSRYVWYASVSSEVFSISFFPLVTSANGDGEIRTLDPLLARQVLSQLSYTPIGMRAFPFFKAIPLFSLFPLA